MPVGVIVNSCAVSSEYAFSILQLVFEKFPISTHGILKGKHTSSMWMANPSHLLGSG